jgi:hypothetical protein
VFEGFDNLMALIIDYKITIVIYLKLAVIPLFTVFQIIVCYPYLLALLFTVFRRILITFLAIKKR